MQIPKLAQWVRNDLSKAKEEISATWSEFLSNIPLGVVAITAIATGFWMLFDAISTWEY